MRPLFIHTAVSAIWFDTFASRWLMGWEHLGIESPFIESICLVQVREYFEGLPGNEPKEWQRYVRGLPIPCSLHASQCL